MKSFTTAVALASLVPAVMSLTINTPSSVVQCQPQLLSWSEGAPPYYLSVIPGGQASAAPLKTFDTQSGNTLTWKVELAAGTQITIALKDSTGALAYTDIVTIQQGPDTSCLSNSGSQPAAPAAPPAAPPAAQDVSVNTASTPSSGVSSPVTSSVVVLQTGTIRPTSSAPGVTASRAASVASASSSATQSVSRTTTSARAAATSSSGAESSLIGHSYGFVGAVGLIGALFL